MSSRNAGVMAMPDERTADGYDIQMQCNGLSHFLLTALLMPALESASKARGEERIVQHSSGARFFPLGKHPTTHYMAACEANTLGGNGGAFAVANFAARRTRVIIIPSWRVCSIRSCTP